MHKWKIGNVNVTQIIELTTASLGPHLLPQATPEVLNAIPWMRPFTDDEGKMVLSMHSLIIESQGQTIMVDTCIGNDKERNYPRWNHMQGDFLDKFASAGFTMVLSPPIDETKVHRQWIRRPVLPAGLIAVLLRRLAG